MSTETDKRHKEKRHVIVFLEMYKREICELKVMWIMMSVTRKNYVTISDYFRKKANFL